VDDLPTIILSSSRQTSLMEKPRVSMQAAQERWRKKQSVPYWSHPVRTAMDQERGGNPHLDQIEIAAF
jgi:hypothetical protein